MNTETVRVRGSLRPSAGRTFWVNALFAPRTSLGFMRIDFILGEILVISFTQMLFFAYVAGLAHNPASSVAYVVVGNAVSTITYASVFSVCQTSDREKEQGTIEPLLVTPTNRIALYAGRGVVPVAVSMGTVAMGLVYAIWVFHAPVAPGAFGPVTISVVLTSLAMVGFGLLLGGIALYLRTSIILGNLFVFLGLLLSGANFPLSELPAPLADVGYGLPLTWGIAAVRAAMAGGSWGSLATLWGILVLEGAACYALAFALWGTFERRAYRTGSLARF
jgi:ABC-2 type transport system permease protein